MSPRGRWDEPAQGKRGFEGLSAYEVAVKNGFVGTEQQWLDSLRGVTTVVEAPGGGGGSGTVTSVAVANATGITWTGSPITTAGTFTPTLSANLQSWSGINPANKVDTTRTIATTAPLAGGGDLSANRTLSITAATTVADGSMSAADKTKLDSVASGASVSSVAVTGSTGLVVGGSPITSAGTVTLTLDTGLQNLASYNTSAFLVQTSTNVFAGRTLTGTASRLSVTNGTGVAGNPVFDIDAAYAGQATITTLGTITTGTWNGTAIAAARGGTGQTVYAVGDILYASTTTALSKLADVATGNALISGGVGVAPAWGKIALTTHVSGVLPLANGGALSNTYTPTVTGIANVASATAFVTSYMRIGNIVTVSGRVDVNPTAGSTQTDVGVSFPIASSIVNFEQCTGHASEISGSFMTGGVFGDVTAHRANVRFASAGTTTHFIMFTFMYQVI